MILEKGKKLTRMHKDVEDRTYNPVGGRCPHQCYKGACYANILINLRKWKKYEGALRLVEDVSKKTFPPDEIWFIGSMTDPFAHEVDERIILKLFKMIRNNPKTKFLVSTKNPGRYYRLLSKGIIIPKNTILGCTIESNINYYDLSKAPPQTERLFWMYKLAYLTHYNYELFIAVEPVLYFLLDEFVKQLTIIKPWKVAVGYNNYPHIQKLPEPTLQQTLELIERLEAHGIAVERKKLREAIPCYYEGQLYPLKEGPQIVTSGVSRNEVR